MDNHWKPWTFEQEVRVWELKKIRTRIKDIAKDIGRSPSSVTQRLSKIRLQMRRDSYYKNKIESRCNQNSTFKYRHTEGGVKKNKNNHFMNNNKFQLAFDNFKRNALGWGGYVRLNPGEEGQHIFWGTDSVSRKDIIKDLDILEKEVNRMNSFNKNILDVINENYNSLKKENEGANNSIKKLEQKVKDLECWGSEWKKYAKKMKNMYESKKCKCKPMNKIFPEWKNKSDCTKAYRQLQLLWHPDKTPREYKDESNNMSKYINKLYNKIST